MALVTPQPNNLIHPAHPYTSEVTTMTPSIDQAAWAEAKREAAARAEQDLRNRLNRIRALLASAEDDSYPEDIREQYNAKAAELLASYGIDRAMLYDADPRTDVIGDLVVHIPNPFFVQKEYLLAVVAKQFGVRAVVWRRRNEVHLFGFESDLERVELLFTSLLVQVATSINRRVPAWGAAAANYRRSFLLGFAATVGRRLEAANKVAHENTPTSSTGRSTELVLASRADLVDRRVAEAYPALGKPAKMTFRRDRAAMRDGVEAGNRADLGQTRVTPTTANRRLPGGR